VSALRRTFFSRRTPAAPLDSDALLRGLGAAHVEDGVKVDRINICFSLRRTKTGTLLSAVLLVNVRDASLPRPIPCAMCNNRGNKPAGRPAAQMERLLAVRNPNKSQVFPVKEPNGSRIPPGRSSLPFGKACNALGSSNRVPERTPDQQR
jgi:hypothetical protein